MARHFMAQAGLRQNRRRLVGAAVAAALLAGGGGAVMALGSGRGAAPVAQARPTVPATTATPTTTASRTVATTAPKRTAVPAKKVVAPPKRTTTPAPAARDASRTTPPAVKAAPRPKPSPRPVVVRTTTAVKPAPVPVSGGIAGQVLALVNTERAKVGCRNLSANSALQRAAQGHSADMAANDYFSHTSQDGRTFADRIRAAGYPGGAIAENIAAGQSTASAVMKSWMDSAGHRANILNCSYRALGVGYAKGGSFGTYWTQDFGG